MKGVRETHTRCRPGLEPGPIRRVGYIEKRCSTTFVSPLTPVFMGPGSRPGRQLECGACAPRICHRNIFANGTGQAESLNRLNCPSNYHLRPPHPALTSMRLAASYLSFASAPLS